MKQNLTWYFSRLRSMNLQEVIWRLQQSLRKENERKKYFSLNKPVTEMPLCPDLKSLHIDIEKLPINWENDKWTVFAGQDLFGVFEYSSFKNRWHAGFQTENSWSENDFSPDIVVGQREDIGDIRTNWELNRHYQFASLAKSYFCTRDELFLHELKKLFSDWNSHNLFLHGVEWFSAMEIAIRVNSWVYAYAFLKKAGVKDDILEKLQHGIIFMADYILKHRARFSSANNHLIVEMYAVALVGIITDYKLWINEAIKILTEELPRQNYPDGVNKEMATHYQSFVMEAYGLLWLLMLNNSIAIPSIWKKYLSAMSEFLADSTDDYNLTMEFGDNDEGKILDLQGKLENHYQYVLNLMSCLLEKKYTSFEWHENLNWIVPNKLRTDKETYIPEFVCSRKEGGYTFLRSKDRRVMIGLDHADLGFGSIAAHGHADALSFKMNFCGRPILVDSGTFNYHIPLEVRDYFRKTSSHNTVKIEDHEQSEIIGPFLWGKKAKNRIVTVNEKDQIFICECNNQYGENHKRTIQLFDNKLIIKDDINDKKGTFYLHFMSDIHILNIEKNKIKTNSFTIIFSNDNLSVEKCYISNRYNNIHESNKVIISFTHELETVIVF